MYLALTVLYLALTVLYVPYLLVSGPSGGVSWVSTLPRAARTRLGTVVQVVSPSLQCHWLSQSRPESMSMAPTVKARQSRPEFGFDCLICAIFARKRPVWRCVLGEYASKRYWDPPRDRSAGCSTDPPQDRRTGYEPPFEWLPGWTVFRVASGGVYWVSTGASWGFPLQER